MAIQLIGDSSVVLKWFLTEREDELDAAEALGRANTAQAVQVLILDLTLYEVGNILLRKRWQASHVADQIEDLLTICGPPVVLEPEWRRDAAALSQEHKLTYYDACYAAAARGLRVALVSADRQLLDAGLAESVTAFVERLRLR